MINIFSHIIKKIDGSASLIQIVSLWINSPKIKISITANEAFREAAQVLKKRAERSGKEGA